MLGLWDALEHWKRAVHDVALGTQLRRTHQSFAVWDFADYSTLTTEAVPPPGDVQARMQWYWESSHYKKPLGDRVLDRIFEVPQGRAPQDFGVLVSALSASALEQHLQDIRERGTTYRASHPGDVADLQRLAAQLDGHGRPQR